MITSKNSDKLIADARTILTANDLGHSTKPAPNLYPHQWNWDSCFIAIGISHYDTQRAMTEIRSLLSGQWTNGLVPQIIFNPEADGYFPGPDVWQSTRSPDAPLSVQTSGITQPPMLAIAALAIWKNATDKDSALQFLKEVYPKILLYHQFLYSARDPQGSGIVAVLHPWESGLDNSPPYLDAGSRVVLRYKPTYERLDLLHVSAKNRPTNKDYDLFVYLVEQMCHADWNQHRYLEVATLSVDDVLFNSILCRANADLARIADLVGEDPVTARFWRERAIAAINEKLWDETDGTYYSYDRVAGHLLKNDTIGAFLTLFGGVAPPDRAQRLVEERMLHPKKFWPAGGFGIPSTAMDSTWYNPENYWLGPVWINTNWMIMHGLRGYGFNDLADTIGQLCIDLVAHAGFREYYDPLTGDGYGTDSFSWTAALTIDLLMDAGASQ